MDNGSYSGLLRNRGFQAFLWTQFLGAFNDNLFKMIVSVMAVGMAAGRGGSYLSLAGAVFVLPYLLFSGYAGQLADRYSKTRVLVVTKSFEIVIMMGGIAALASGRMDWMLAVLFLLAAHSAFFSPAKYGIVPEMLAERDLSRANALLEMTTFVAIVLGTSIGSFLYAGFANRPVAMGIAMLVIAIAGSAASFGIPAMPAVGGAARMRWNPAGEVWDGMRAIWRDRPLWLTVAGISFFWFVGGLVQMSVLLLGKETLGLGHIEVGWLVACLAVGIGAGSMAAGRLSGGRIELGLAPLGALGMGVAALALGSASSFVSVAGWLLVLGFAGGLFAVPLNAFLEVRPAAAERGRIIATNNFFNTLGVMAASGALWLLHDSWGWPAPRILGALGVLSLAATVVVIRLAPDFSARFLLWLMTHTFFRIRIAGRGNLPLQGPALLVANHVSYVDGFLIGACIQRFVRFLVYRPIYESWWAGWFLRGVKAIPVAGGTARDAAEAIRAARAELAAGHVVCIFAEGAITRDGEVQPFKRGFEKMAKGLNVPVIPVHLDGLWGSVFSFSGGRALWKWPRRMFDAVTVSFGAPMNDATADAVRQAVLDLKPAEVLGERFRRVAIRNWFRTAMTDSTGKTLTYGRAWIAANLLSGRLRRMPEPMIGLMLPASVGGAVANLAVAMAGRTAVNLNFSLGREAMEAAVSQCGIRSVLTSRVFLAKSKLEAPAGAVYLEDLALSLRLREKLAAALGVFRKVEAESPAAVIFSSGSTGVPKGVMLSHGNIGSNVDAVGRVFGLGRGDCLIGSLPFFHSFGYSFTLWFPLLQGIRVAYHANPMDARAIGELTRANRGTFLLTTPTFAQIYTRRCSKEEFASLRYVLVGAEKLRETVAREFEDKFGVAMLEGYGCTEMAPVVAVNRPGAVRRGSVGQPVPGVSVRVDEDGVLLVNGPNRMMGYLGQPEKTAEVLRDGWYVTGDIGHVDSEGYVWITDRVSRFSKIGGEMVPHLKVEEAIDGVLGERASVVVGVPDETRGERLVALYSRPDWRPAELRRRLALSGLPNLWIPKVEDFVAVEALPVLGSGKVDLRRARGIFLDFRGGWN
jgi:acyl-[acyl-carrier-protein]-phospholipid O-acyltransferase/long-chain-fatty-acid--[acyl-carrier-protein] ligase